ncbi:MAG: hypothetical protein RIF33_17490 [Cyclobacteriaceae bacterium]
MKAIVFAVLFLFSALTISAQLLQGDVISTDNGDLTIQPILHGTLGLEWNGKVIYIDPYGGEEAFAIKLSAHLSLLT